MDGLVLEMRDVKLGEDERQFNFANVLPVVLEMISEYLDGYDIMAMYRTNSYGLGRRMRVSVREMRVKRGSPLPSWNASFWSVMKACPYLRTISLLDPTLSIWKHGPHLFEQLPQAVEKLFFHLPFLFGDYLLIHPSTNRLSLTQKQLKLFTGDNHRHGGPIPLWSLKSLFPNLSTFSVAHAPSRARLARSFDAFSRRIAIKNFFQECPTSLQEISLPESFDDALALPQTVSSICLSLSIEDNIEDICKDISPHMRSLELHTRVPNGIFDFSTLPPSLERLTLQNSINTSDLIIYHGFKKLSIVSLSINCQHGHFYGNAGQYDVFADLPPTLTELSYSSNRSMSFNFANLPQGLTNLEISVANPLLIEASRLCFPPRLTRLILHAFRFVTNDVVRMPRTLTFMQITFVLPWTTPTILPTEDITPFTRALENPAELDPQGEVEWQDAASLFLPPNLLHLRCTRSQLGASWFKYLPSKLLTLTINTSQKFGPTSLNSLPETLTELNIVSTGGFGNEAIDNLPESLERLSIECMMNKVTDSIFRKLPRSLLYLELQHNNTIRDDSIKDLPRLLTTFIAPQSELLSSNCASKLPRFLSSLQVKRFLLANPRPPKSEILAQMPPFVRAYDLRWANAKGKSVNFDAISN